MDEPEWVLREMVVVAHEHSLSRFGGVAGIRDEGLLDSALTQPRNLFALGSPTAFDLAAGYAFGILRNHPFLGGNPRAGFIGAVVFLELNGYAFQADEVDAALKTLALAAGELKESEYADWLKTDSVAVSR